MIINQIFSRADALSSTGISMVTALAWNEAFKNLFDAHPFLKSYGPLAYAILLTIFAVLYATVLNELKHSTKQNTDDEMYVARRSFLGPVFSVK